MSLIQQALDKTSRKNETRAANSSATPKVYDRDPMGAVLDRELSRIQQKYAQHRSLYRRVALGILCVCLVTGFVLVGIHSKKTFSSSVESRGVMQTPVKIFAGYIYRLTGITNIGDKSIAVINNRLVGIGDKLNGKAVVTAIGEGEVRLDVQGREIKLAL